MAIYHVSLAFAQYPDPQLDEFASNVVIKMAGNVLFTTPIVSMGNLGTAQVMFHNSLAAITQGGSLAMANKLTARNTLIALLRQEANYVQGIANNNEATILASGFLSTTVSHTQSPLDTPVISNLTNGASTQLVATVNPVKNAGSYEVEVSSAPGVWVHAATSQSSRNIVIPGLTPGVMYAVRVRAVGGSTGFSDWSNAVSHMSM